MFENWPDDLTYNPTPRSFFIYKCNNQGAK